MKNVFFLLVFFVCASSLFAQTTAVWNPAANPNTTGAWTDSANWTSNSIPDGNYKVVYNVPSAQDCILDDTVSINQMVAGDNGNGGALVIANGGSLTTGVVWSAIGYNDSTKLVVEAGGEVTFGEHLWVGFIAGGYGEIELNGGTINVAQMTGLGWDGGEGKLALNAGTINMNGFHPTNTIKGNSSVDVKNGMMVINGDQTASANAYVTDGKITAFGGNGTVNVSFDTIANKTIVTASNAAQPTTVWNPAGNPFSTGLWSEGPNWTDSNVPNNNKVVLNVPGAQECVMNITGSVNQIVAGDNGNGGTLKVANGGDLTTGVVWSAIGYNDSAQLVVEAGGQISFGEHMWVGFEPTGYGEIILNGGTINVAQMTGLGWNGGKAKMFLNSGVINMNGFDPANSIKDSSLVDVGNGKMMINGDHTASANAYVADGKIIGFGGTGTVVVTFDTLNNITIVEASAPAQATTVWNPAGNPASTGLWSEKLNWTDSNVPVSNKVVFNVPGAQECVVNDTATANQIVAGDNGPGGTLRIANGGSLTTEVVWSGIGYNDSARLVVDAGGEVTFGEHLWIGFTGGGYGEVVLNGGTINVTQMTGLGWDGGVGKVYVNSGLFNLTGFDANNSIKDSSLIDISNGTIHLAGDKTAIIDFYAAAGKITAFDGNGTLNIVFDTLAATTVVTASIPGQPVTVWNPAGNPASTGLWSEGPNWTDSNVPDANKVIFNVPGAEECLMDVNGSIGQLVMGDNGPGGNLRIASGGNLTTDIVWSAIGYNDSSKLIVEYGGTMTFGEHMWVGFTPGSYGEVELNGGTINVTQMIGIGWDGGKGKVSVNNGVLNLNGFDAANSIKDSSVIDITNGKIVINGDVVAGVDAYATDGKITAFGTVGGVLAVYDTAANQTIVTADGGVGIDDDIRNALKPTLKQNYPNPFSGSTTISFSLAQNSDVELSIYNLVGQKVANLLNQKMGTGDYDTVWNAEQLPGGIYLIGLKTNSGFVTKKVTLLK